MTMFLFIQNKCTMTDFHDSTVPDWRCQVKIFHQHNPGHTRLSGSNELVKFATSVLFLFSRIFSFACVGQRYPITFSLQAPKLHPRKADWSKHHSEVKTQQSTKTLNSNFEKVFSSTCINLIMTSKQADLWCLPTKRSRAPCREPKQRGHPKQRLTPVTPTV